MNINRRSWLEYCCCKVKYHDDLLYIRTKVCWLLYLHRFYNALTKSLWILNVFIYMKFCLLWFAPNIIYIMMIVHLLVIVDRFICCSITNFHCNCRKLLSLNSKVIQSLSLGFWDFSSINLYCCNNEILLDPSEEYLHMGSKPYAIWLMQLFTALFINAWWHFLIF